MDLDDADTVATTACDDTAADDIDVAPPCIYHELPKRGHFSLTNIIANNKLDYLHSLQDNVTGLHKLLPEVSELLNATNLFSGSVAELEPEKMNEDLAPTTLPREFWNKKIVDYDDNERARLKLWLAETRDWRVATKQVATVDEQAQTLEQDKIDTSILLRAKKSSTSMVFLWSGAAKLL